MWKQRAEIRRREQRRRLSSLPPPRVAFRQQKSCPAKRTDQPGEGDRTFVASLRRGKDVADAVGVIDQKGIKTEGPAPGVELFERTVRPDAYAAAAHLE